MITVCFVLNDFHFSLLPSGGLADCAQQLMARDSTSLVLWQKEIEAIPSISRIKPRCDLRVFVETILQSSLLRNAQATSARTVLALCRILDDSTAQVTDGSEPSKFHIMFKSDPRRSEPGSVSEIKSGSTILVWKPWFEFQNPIGTREPTTLATGSQNSPTDSSYNNNASSILCSRFVVQSP